MKIKRLSLLLFLSALFLTLPSCKNDDDQSMDDDVAATDDDMGPTDDNPDDNPDDTPPDVLGTVEFFNRDLVEDSFVLVNDAGSNRAYLMDKEAELVHEWPLSNNIGNDVFLLPNGQVLAILEADTPLITFGGKGGKVQLIENDGTISWNFDYSSEDFIAHHDVELLPNGNIIVMVWERRTAEQGAAAGSNLDFDIFPEAIIEVNPATDEIVWEWHAWDHLVQDFDDTKENFGSIADNPQLINLNYDPNEKGDIMHANGIAYDEINDLIYLSVNFYHEVWVIDHSTTTEEAASSAGGNFNKGGDLVYRFGNPSAYNNPEGERLFFNNHFPNLLPDDGSAGRKMLIYVNMLNGTEQSVVYELQLPATYDLQANTDNEPTVIWSFTDPDLFAPRVSGAVRLENGNTLITQGNAGYWEVTGSGEVVWKFTGEGFYWRGYGYAKDAPEVLSLLEE